MAGRTRFDAEKSDAISILHHIRRFRRPLFRRSGVFILEEDAVSILEEDAVSAEFAVED